MVIKHEFPEWDFISSFQLFNVSSDRKTSATECRDVHIQRMAKFFKLDLVQFRSQLEDLSALARAHSKSTGCDSYNAWRRTIEKVTSTARRAQAHPCDVLLVALVRWAGWSLSSSGVEQSFGHGTHFATARQSAASEATECNDMVLLLDHDPSTEEQLIQLARQARSSINSLNICLTFARQPSYKHIDVSE